MQMLTGFLKAAGGWTPDGAVDPTGFNEPNGELLLDAPADEEQIKANNNQGN